MFGLFGSKPEAETLEKQREGSLSANVKAALAELIAWTAQSRALRDEAADQVVASALLPKPDSRKATSSSDTKELSASSNDPKPAVAASASPNGITDVSVTTTSTAVAAPSHNSVDVGAGPVRKWKRLERVEAPWVYASWIGCRWSGVGDPSQPIYTACVVDGPFTLPNGTVCYSLIYDDRGHVSMHVPANYISAWGTHPHAQIGALIHNDIVSAAEGMRQEASKYIAELLTRLQSEWQIAQKSEALERQERERATVAATLAKREQEAADERRLKAKAIQVHFAKQIKPEGYIWLKLGECTFVRHRILQLCRGQARTTFVLTPDPFDCKTDAELISGLFQKYADKFPGSTLVETKVSGLKIILPVNSSTNALDEQPTRIIVSCSSLPTGADDRDAARAILSALEPASDSFLFL